MNEPRDEGVRLTFGIPDAVFDWAPATYSGNVKSLTGKSIGELAADIENACAAESAAIAAYTPLLTPASP